MLFWIIPLITFVAALVYWIFVEEEFLLGLLISILSAILALLVTFLLGCGIIGCCDTEWVETNTTEIVALSDAAGLEGQIYLRRGYIEDKLSYYYIVDTQFGLKADSVSADKCYIKYTNDKPYMVTYKETIKNGFVRWAFGDIISSTRYTIYLPEGSVITDYYEIDLE
jgi:hypothetical protein